MDKNAIIPDDQHQQTRALLAWYINGTLDPDEDALVEAHLAQCPACRAELAEERRLVADLPEPQATLDADAGWAAMRRRMEQATPPEAEDDLLPPDNVVALPARSFWRRPIPLGWALTAQAAALALVVGAGSLWSGHGTVHGPAPGTYHARSAPTPMSGANMLVMFRSDLPESDMRSILLAHDAQLAGGPNANGAYLLHVAPSALSGTLSRLHADPRITMAEPIDESGQ